MGEGDTDLNCWVLYPSANHERAARCRDLWRQRGYRVGIFLDRGSPTTEADIVVQGEFHGYWAACNLLSRIVFHHRGAEVVTLIGDDMIPDPLSTASSIGEAYLRRFPDGFGIMQATGDPQGKDKHGVPAAARICGSPTFGMGWNERAYHGTGPCPEMYKSYWGDEELWNVAKRLGVLWLEPKFSFLHRHWSFGHEPRQPSHEKNEGNSRRDREMFQARKQAGFPGSDPLPEDSFAWEMDPDTDCFM